MELPYHFPSQAEVIAQQAKKFRKLTPSERFLTILDLIASGISLMQHSPHWEKGQELREQQEAEWQRIHRELFAKHGY